MIDFLVFDLHKISEYRNQLMGFGTIAILLCHATGHEVLMPNYISSILSRGGWGVDIFLLLSGMGMYYSLEKNGMNNICYWYCKRFKRLLIPYLLIAIPFYFISAYLNGDSLIYFILNVSTLSFWINHNGMWFIALIIPLYLGSPILYSCAKSTYRKFLSMLVLVVCCFCLSLMNISINGKVDIVISNIQFALIRVPSFLLGLYGAYFVMNNYTVRVHLVCPIVICLGCLLKILMPGATVSFFFIIPVVWFVCTILDLRIKWLNDFFSFMGNISLESYMFNVTLPFFLLRNKWIINGVDFSYGNILPYFMVVVIGIILSIFLKKISISISNVL